MPLLRRLRLSHTLQPGWTSTPARRPSVSCGAAVESTVRPEVIGGIGGFGGLFAMPTGYDRPVLVASTDGVGTKLAVAVQARQAGHDRDRPRGDVRRRPRLPGCRTALPPRLPALGAP